MSLTWRDNANDEDRLQGRTLFVRDGRNDRAPPSRRSPRPDRTRSVTYTDATVTGATATLPGRGVQRGSDSSLRDAGNRGRDPGDSGRADQLDRFGRGQRQQLHGDADLDVGGAQSDHFTIQRATNLSFTTGLTSFTPAGAARTLTQSVTATPSTTTGSVRTTASATRPRGRTPCRSRFAPVTKQVLSYSGGGEQSLPRLVSVRSVEEGA